MLFNLEAKPYVSQAVNFKLKYLNNYFRQTKTRRRGGGGKGRKQREKKLRESDREKNKDNVNKDYLSHMFVNSKNKKSENAREIKMGENVRALMFYLFPILPVTK